MRTLPLEFHWRKRAKGLDGGGDSAGPSRKWIRFSRYNSRTGENNSPRMLLLFHRFGETGNSDVGEQFLRRLNTGYLLIGIAR